MKLKVPPAQKISYFLKNKLHLKKKQNKQTNKKTTKNKQKPHKTNRGKIEKEKKVGTIPKAGTYTASSQNKDTENQG